MNQLLKSSSFWSDQQIIEGILIGGKAENDAIGALFDKFKNILIRFLANKMPKDTAKEPEDFVWEGIEALVINVKKGTYQPQAGISLEAYIKTICKNLWHRYLTSEVARDARQETYFGFDSEPDLDISELIINKEKWDYYLSIFDKAGKNCKEILHLSFAEDMPMKELAEKLISEGKYENDQVVRNAKSKCLKKIIDFL